MPTPTPLRQGCAECGFDPAAFSTGDGAVAARSLARRWRELFAAVAETDDGESLLREPMSSGWSAVDRAGRVARVFSRCAGDLDRVWALDNPEVETDDALCREGWPAPSERLVELTSSAERLAHAIDRYDGDAWARLGNRGGQPLTAAQLVEEAIHEGAHHLRLARRELAEACDAALDEEVE